ncbi:condensation domain-containing protein [Actinoplanes sp. NPDC049316]|uniref:condensation domain-containing protein n=1 Tax=Actinoplanes sp. NPDC049316 TaxID=3154727 RepID=UPI00342AE600
MPRPEVPSAAGPDEYGERSLPPRTPYEDAMVGILGEVLGRSGIDVQDRLLDLGDVSQAPRVVAQIRRTIGVDVPVADYAEARTVAGLAAVVAARSFAARSITPPRRLGPRPPGAEPVLSFDQRRLWMENQLLPGSIYNVHGRRRILGKLDVAVVEAGIRAIVARHETLRTRFPATGADPVQTVDEVDDGWVLPVHDLTGLRGQGPDDLAGRTALRLLDEELTTPFDLVTGPLLRCALIKLGEEEHLLSVTMHHIVSDAWSIGLFVRELTALYRAGGDPERAGLAPLPVQYRDYAVWQRGWLTGDALEYQVGHWRRHLHDAPRALALPTVERRTNAMRAEAGQVLAELSPAETTDLHRLCRSHGVTSFMVLYAVLATIFARWSGQEDLVIGVPVAGRTNSVTDRLIGFFVNMLPLRADLSGNPRFSELLERVRRTALDGYAHAEAPMDELVRELEIVRDPRRTPLFEVVLNVVASPEAEQVSGLTIAPMDTPSLFSRYDLTFTAQESGGVLRFKLDFPADRCDQATGLALLDQVRTLLRAAVQDPSVRLLDVPAAADEPAGTALEPSGTPYAALARAAADPQDLVAVADGAGRWSYRQLHVAARRVAAELTRRGVTGGGQVGLVRRPTAGFVAALTGAAAAGVPCAVLETDDPALTGPLDLAVVLDTDPAGEPAAGTVDLSGILPAGDVPAPPAPGPVPADWAARRYGFCRGDRFVVLCSRPGHLMSALHSAFAAGATLMIPSCSFAGDGSAVIDWLRENAVTVAYVDAPILRAITARRPALPDLTTMIVDNDGDLLPHDVEAIREAAPGCRCVAVHHVLPDGRPAAVHDVPAGLAARTAPLRVPLGTPLPGVPLELRRAGGQPAATGEPGEILIGGEGTGIRARRRPDGVLEHVGTGLTDPLQTVSALRDIPGVRDALVVGHAAGDGTTVLAGYVSGPAPEAGATAIGQQLKAGLPDYLVPRHLVVLEALPRTPWGAYDLRALPRPAEDGDDGDGYAAPRTPMEEQLTGILAELLTLERVGIYDSFFELGGFSMLATRLIARVRESFGVDLAVRDVFESPTVDELARIVLRAQAEQSGADELEALLAEVEQAGA